MLWIVKPLLYVQPCLININLLIFSVLWHVFFLIPVNPHQVVKKSTLIDMSKVDLEGMKNILWRNLASLSTSLLKKLLDAVAGFGMLQVGKYHIPFMVLYKS